MYRITYRSSFDELQRSRLALRSLTESLSASSTDHSIASRSEQRILFLFNLKSSGFLLNSVKRLKSNERFRPFFFFYVFFPLSLDAQQKDNAKFLASLAVESRSSKSSSTRSLEDMHGKDFLDQYRKLDFIDQGSVGSVFAKKGRYQKMLLKHKSYRR